MIVFGTWGGRSPLFAHNAHSYGGATKRGRKISSARCGLVVNAIVLWNTRYMDAVLSKLQADGDAIADADARRLSPLVHKHLNFLGRYHFSLPGDVRAGELRELRDPNAGLEEEWLLPVGSP